MTRHRALLGGFLMATVVAVAVACGGGETGAPTPTSTATPDATGTPDATPSPVLTPTTAPTPATVPTGSPFSFDDLQATFEARGMAVTLVGPSAGFSGFGTSASDVRLVRGDDSMELSMLVYADREVIKEDWELTIGQSPLPKEGRSVPDHISTWWNENILVVVRASVGDIASDALDAFLALDETAASEASVGQLAYVGADGAIWLVNADGSGRTQLATDPCGGEGRPPVGLAWSPHGDKLALVCLSADASQRTLVVLDESGQPVTKVERVGGSPIWSPDGQQLAYQTDAFIGTQSPQYEVRMLDLTTLKDISVAEDAFLLEWPLPDRMLVGLNVQDPGLGFNYDAHWLDHANGQTEPIPYFDDSRLFWLSPDATKAVLVGKEDGPPALAIYDLETSEERPIPSSVIRYPSEFIPSRHVAFSGDGSTLYWADVHFPTDVYRAAADGGEPTKLASLVSAAAVEFSPDRTKIAHIVAGNPPILWTSDIDGSNAHEIGRVFNAFAWRPTP